jgi:hypothetical protein
MGGFPEHPAFRGPAAGEDVAFKRALYRHFQVQFVERPFLKYRVQRGSHFERFLDATKVVDNQMVFTRQTPGEQDGSLAAAQAAYLSGVEARLSIVEQCLRDQPLGLHGWQPLFQYEQLRTALASPGSIDPREGYVLYRCAALAPANGSIGAPRRAHESVWKWLNEGARFVGRPPAEALEDRNGNGEAAAMRLLVVDVSDGSQGWISDLNANVVRLAAGAYVIVFGVPERANLDGVHQALKATKQRWRQLARIGRLVAFEKVS